MPRKIDGTEQGDKQAEDQEIKPWTVRLPRAYIRAFKTYVAQNDTSAQEVAEQLFARFLQEKNMLPASRDEYAKAS